MRMKNLSTGKKEIPVNYFLLALAWKRTIGREEEEIYQKMLNLRIKPIPRSVYIIFVHILDNFLNTKT